MTNYRYTLENYAGSKTRFKCPKCQNKSNSFVRYIDTETGEYVNETVGRCNREVKCGYHLKPKQFFENNCRRFYYNIESHGLRSVKMILNQQKPTFFPSAIYEDSLLPTKNNFIAYLSKILGQEAAMKLREVYRIGSSDHWKGATVFWQIDTKGLIRTGKIMLYNRESGKRIKQPYSHISWAHKVYKLADFELSQCLFGEHLLIGNLKPVGIVESEKTAIICSHFMPEKIWLATGGKSNFRAELFQKLEDRQVTFFPDLGAYDSWEHKIKNEFSFITHRSIDTTLEGYATEKDRADGLDIADYLLKENGLFS